MTEGAQVAEERTREKPMLWMPMQTPYGIPRYYRVGAGKYSLRRVMEPKGATNTMEKKWALYCKEKRLHELQAYSGLETAMEQAENWMRENKLIR